MTNTEIIDQLLKCGSVQYNENFYFLDMIEGGAWGLFRCPLRPWGYDESEKQFICSFSLR